MTDHHRDLEYEVLSLSVQLTAAHTQIQELRHTAALLEKAEEQLRMYGQHTDGCAIHACANCGHRLWLHDRADDIDEVTCVYQVPGLSFMPKHCNCGFAEVVAKQRERL